MADKETTELADFVLGIMAIILVGSFAYECWVAGSLIWQYAHG